MGVIDVSIRTTDDFSGFNYWNIFMGHQFKNTPLSMPFRARRITGSVGAFAIDARRRLSIFWASRNILMEFVSAKEIAWLTPTLSLNVAIPKTGETEGGFRDQRGDLVSNHKKIDKFRESLTFKCDSDGFRGSITHRT